MGTTLGRATPDSVLELFDHALDRAPDRLAVIGTGAAHSYRELDAAAWALHDAIVAAGAGHGSRVGFLGEQDADFPALVLAIFRAGAVFVPLDPSWPDLRTSELVARARVDVIVATGEAGLQLAHRYEIPAVFAPTAARLAPGNPSPMRRRHPHPASAAYLTHTSGSTGTPKGVLTSHRSLVELARRLSVRLGMDATSRVLQYHPAATDIALEELVIAWAVGGTIVALPSSLRTDLSSFADHLEAHRVSVVDLPTSFWLVWMEAIERGDIAPPGGVLRAVGIGSEPLPPGAVERWTSLRGITAGLYNLYGSTETSVTTIVDGPLAPSGSTHERSSSSVIGTPLAGVVHYILDKDLRPVRQGQPGELYLSGEAVALGYDGDPRRTARAFIPDPFAERPGTRMYAMGDEVRELPDGRLEYRGRIDEKFFVHGFTVHPAEIEQVLHAVPGVRSAHVHADRVDTVTRLVADIIPEAPDDEVAQGWREIYDALYADGTDESTHLDGLDTRSWLSSVDGQPIARDVMARWRDGVVAKLRAEQPRRVLDLGCGTGMILHGIADRIERYVGVDFSTPGISALRDSAAEKWTTIDTEFIESDIGTALTAIDEQFDMVVLNSVIQYFPDLHELERILTLASGAVAPGGVLVVGDVRNLDTDADFRSWLNSRMDLSARGGRIGADPELLVSPTYFTALRELTGRPILADVTAKYIDDGSEMTLFRFDAVLRFDTDPAPSPQDPLLHRALSASQVVDADLASLTAPGAPVLIRDVRREVPGERHDPTAVRIGELRRCLAAEGVLMEAAPSAHESLRVDMVVFAPADRASAMELLRQTRVHDASRTLANDPRAALDQQLVLAIDREARSQLRPHERPTQYRVLRGSGFVTVPLRRDAPEAEESDQRAMSPIEQDIAAIWSLVLGQAPSPTDDFFALGGNSLNLARVLVRLRTSYGVELSVQEFFAAPTVRGIAKLVSDSQGTAQEANARPERLPVGTETTGPASFAQERLWMLDELYPGSQAYHSPFAFDIEGTLDVGALRVAASTTAMRHATLRTALYMADGAVVQSITEREPEVCEILVPSAEEPPVPGSLSQAELDFVARPFSLSTGEVFRVGWTRLGERRHRLVFVMHHIAVDELSLHPLFDDFGTAYRAAASGTTPSFPKVAAHYLDYARWERSGATESARTGALA